MHEFVRGCALVPCCVLCAGASVHARDFLTRVRTRWIARSVAFVRREQPFRSSLRTPEPVRRARESSGRSDSGRSPVGYRLLRTGLPGRPRRVQIFEEDALPPETLSYEFSAPAPRSVRPRPANASDAGGLRGDGGEAVVRRRYGGGAALGTSVRFQRRGGGVQHGSGHVVLNFAQLRQVKRAADAAAAKSRSRRHRVGTYTPPPAECCACGMLCSVRSRHASVPFGARDRNPSGLVRYRRHRRRG